MSWRDNITPESFDVVVTLPALFACVQARGQAAAWVVPAGLVATSALLALERSGRECSEQLAAEDPLSSTYQSVRRRSAGTWRPPRRASRPTARCTRQARHGRAQRRTRLNRAAKIANTPEASSKGGKASGGGKRNTDSSQGGTKAQEAAAGRTGGKKSG